MAKVVSPFLSIDASGTIEKSLTASIWKGQQYIRRWFRPTNPKTTNQQAARQSLANAVQAWQGLYDADKTQWNEAARDVYPPISGFNYCVMQYRLQNIEPPNVPTIPTIAPKKDRVLHGRATYGL